MISGSLHQPRILNHADDLIQKINSITDSINTVNTEGIVEDGYTREHLGFDMTCVRTHTCPLIV